MHVDEKDGEVSIRDITQEYACLALWGPKSRDVLKKITSDDVSNEAHPYLMTKPININGAKVLAQRVSYAGELGLGTLHSQQPRHDGLGYAHRSRQRVWHGTWRIQSA